MNNVVTSSILLSTFWLLSTQQLSHASQQTVYADVELKVTNSKAQRAVSFAEIEKLVGKLEDELTVEHSNGHESLYGEMLCQLSGTLLLGTD